MFLGKLEEVLEAAGSPPPPCLEPTVALACCARARLRFFESLAAASCPLQACPDACAGARPHASLGLPFNMLEFGTERPFHASSSRLRPRRQSKLRAASPNHPSSSLQCTVPGTPLALFSRDARDDFPVHFGQSFLPQDADPKCLTCSRVGRPRPSRVPLLSSSRCPRQAHR